MTVQPLGETRRSLDTATRLLLRSRNAMRRGIPQAAKAYILEAFVWLDDSLALIDATGNETEYAAWVAAVDRAIDARRKPYTQREWPAGVRA